MSSRQCVQLLCTSISDGDWASINFQKLDVRVPGDIQAALAFSRATNVPIVIRNTGHDFKGRSSAPYSLALWVHNLRNVSLVMFGVCVV